MDYIIEKSAGCWIFNDVATAVIQTLQKEIKNHSVVS